MKSEKELAWMFLQLANRVPSLPLILALHLFINTIPEKVEVVFIL